MGINFISGLRDKKFFHDFHMMFDQERIGKLKGFIRLFENIEKFWELIEFLLEYFYMFLEEEHFWVFQKESRYELIHHLTKITGHTEEDGRFLIPYPLLYEI